MGKPVEVRVLSRAVTHPGFSQVANTDPTMPAWKAGYFEALLLAAQRAFISSDSLFRPAGVSAPFFLAGGDAFLPAPFLLAAQRAFINRESFLLPAGVS
jgi:hypothetical protein